MVQRTDLAGQEGVSFHVGAEVTVIDTVQGIQLDGVAFEMAREKGGLHPKTGFPALALHIVEKDGKVVIVPNHNSKGVEKGTYYSILRQAGLK